MAEHAKFRQDPLVDKRCTKSKNSWYTKGWEEDVEERARDRRRRRIERQIDLEQTTVDKLVSRRMLRVKSLNEKQRMAILMLSDFMHDYSARFIAESCDISTPQLYKWRNDPFFIAELNKEITTRKSMFRNEAFRQFFNKLRRGDKWAMQTYFKMTGDLKNVHVHEGPGEDTPASLSELDKEIMDLQSQLDSVKVRERG